MSYQIFIKIDGIKGESTDVKHKGEIDVLAWSWGVANIPAETVGNLGGAVGKAAASDLTFCHRIDLATPALIKACIAGRRSRGAVITVQKAGPAPQRLLMVKLHGVIVKSVQTNAENGDNGLTENVALSFTRMELVYNEQKPDGTVVGSDRVFWDLISNKVA